MLWFYTREHDSLRLETRFDNETREYVGILTFPNGRQNIRRFDTAASFRTWLETIEHDLAGQRWAPDGPPHILPDGWPDKTPDR